MELRFYKKFDMIEKFALCYAVKNQIPENTCFDKVTLTKIQTILRVVEETQLWTKDHEVTATPLDVFNYGAELLLSATKINHFLLEKYPNIASKIKKMNDDLAIHSISDMKFHGSDLVEINNGVAGPYIKDIMDELSTEVVLGKVENDYKALRERAVELLKSKTNTIEGEITDPHEIVSDDEVKTIENPANELVSAKVRFDIEFTDLLKSNLSSFIKGNETPEEVEKLELVISKSIRETLIKQNPEYQELEEKGLI